MISSRFCGPLDHRAVPHLLEEGRRLGVRVEPFGSGHERVAEHTLVAGHDLLAVELRRGLPVVHHREVPRCHVRDHLGRVEDPGAGLVLAEQVRDHLVVGRDDPDVIGTLRDLAAVDRVDQRPPDDRVPGHGLRRDLAAGREVGCRLVLGVRRHEHVLVHVELAERDGLDALLLEERSLVRARRDDVGMTPGERRPLVPRGELDDPESGLLSPSPRGSPGPSSSPRPGPART